jgi:hypothetical protein
MLSKDINGTKFKAIAANQGQSSHYFDDNRNNE